MNVPAKKTAPPGLDPGAQALAATEPAPAADREVMAKPLPESRWSLLEQNDPGHWVCLERGTPYESVFEPSFWANIVKRAKFAPGQTIRLVNDEMTVFAELKILECGRNWAVVGEWMRKNREDLERSRPPTKKGAEHHIGWGGPIDKFRILRKGDNAVIRAGFESEAQARIFLDNYLRQIGA
jgi:hypothetical protein